MPNISKINALAIGSVGKVDGLAKASILDIDGVAVPSAFTGLLDTYTGAAAGYSTRRLASSATVLMRVRRETAGGTGDDDEADVAYDSNNELSLDSAISNASVGVTATTLGQFLNVGTVGGTTYSNPDSLTVTASCFVDEWKDQSGNANHGTQATHTFQPQIHSGTVNTDLITENGKAAIDNDGLSGNHFVLSNALGNVSTYSVFAVLEDGIRNPATGEGSMLFVKGSADWIWYVNTSFITVNATGNSKNIPTSWSTAQRLDYHALASGTASFGTNASTLDTVSSVLGGVPMDFILGHYATAGNYNYNGKVQELIIYTSDQSSNRSGIESNINGFFSIYP